jgi:hypothetical protein
MKKYDINIMESLFVNRIQHTTFDYTYCSLMFDENNIKHKDDVRCRLRMFHIERNNIQECIEGIETKEICKEYENLIKNNKEIILDGEEFNICVGNFDLCIYKEIFSI